MGVSSVACRNVRLRGGGGGAIWGANYMNLPKVYQNKSIENRFFRKHAEHRGLTKSFNHRTFILWTIDFIN